MSSIYLAGSRSLQLPSSQVAQVTLATLQAGHTIRVGCCIGADQAVINSAMAAGGASFLVVFAIFTASGRGACSLSAVQTVQAAGNLGASVRYLAGGPLNVPLAARLISRSVAAFSGSSAAVFFQPGTGSLAVAALAASQQIPVYVFSSGTPAPLAPQGGQWVASSFAGFPCVQWSPAQIQLF